MFTKKCKQKPFFFFPVSLNCLFHSIQSTCWAPTCPVWPVCSLVQKKSAQYLKHQRSAALKHSTVCFFVFFQYGLPAKVIIYKHRWKKMHISERSNHTYGVNFTLHSHLNHLADAFTQGDSEKCFSRAYETDRDQQMASV